jgi:hypothetical protein
LNIEVEPTTTPELLIPFASAWSLRGVIVPVVPFGASGVQRKAAHGGENPPLIVIWPKSLILVAIFGINPPMSSVGVPPVDVS